MSKATPVFYCMLRGLRGCYMPDSVEHAGVRDFESFARDVRDTVESDDGLAWNVNNPAEPDAAEVTALIAEAWDHVRHGRLELCLAIGATWDNETPEFNESYGLTIGASDARDLLAYRRECKAA